MTVALWLLISLAVLVIIVFAPFVVVLGVAFVLGGVGAWVAWRLRP